MAKVMILAVFLASVWLGFGLSEAIAWFPITSFLYPTCHCCSKIGQTNGFCFFLVLDWFCFRLFLVLIQFLDALAKPFPMMPHTPQSDLKCMGYRVGQNDKHVYIHTKLIHIFKYMCLYFQANIYKLSSAKVCSNKLRSKINKTSSAWLG